MDGYCRVSRRLGREGPGYISPAVQREAIQRWADYRGIEIVAWHFDEDESGGTQERPGLREAMRRAEAGETDGIACWRLNRFARNVAGAIDDVKRIQAAGGSLAFVEEDIDPTGPFGNFVLTVLLAVATLERENLVEGWKTAKSLATDRGVKIGPTPYGYRRRKDGVLEPDPVKGPIVAEAFRLAAEEGFYPAFDYISKHGKGHRWTTPTLRRLLRARSYGGEARYGDLVKLEAHEPIVSHALWAAAQPSQEARRGRRATFPLSGIATCASCGNPLVGSRAGRKNVRVYRCSSVARRMACAAPVLVTAEPLEAFIRQALKDQLSDRQYGGSDDQQGDIDDTKRALDEASRELDEISTDLALRRSLGPERFRGLVDKAVLAVQTAQEKYRQAAKRSERQMIVSAAQLIDDAELGELRELLGGALEMLSVKRGRGPISDRASITFKGAPVEVGISPPQNAERTKVKARKRGVGQ
jgi:DNA invertase Pin-like site-specific DNA recombinase